MRKERTAGAVDTLAHALVWLISWERLGFPKFIDASGYNAYTT